MPDRERIIAELSERANGAGADAWMTLKCSTAREILALLKEQEARVMALDEIKKDGSSFVWAEIHSPHVQKMALIYCTVKQYEGWRESYLLAEESGVLWARTTEDYNRDLFQGIHSGWRCWTARPTDEQRRTVKWDA